MRNNQMADAKPLAGAQIDVRPVAEYGMDDAPDIANRNQAGAPGRGPAAAARENPPFLQADAGIVQPYQGIGCAGAGRIDPKRLKLTVHGDFP
jgi:hypothetical protein